MTNELLLTRSNTTQRISTKQETLMRNMFLMKIFCVFCLVIAASAFIAGGNNAIKLAEVEADYNKLESDNLALINQYNELYATYDGLYTEYVTNVEYAYSCEDTIIGLNELVNELDEQSQSLAESNEEYYQTIQQYQQREELFDKYEYCIIRQDEGTRTDITYDQLINLEEVAEEKNIDVDLVLSICMVESDGDETCTSTTSTARGYGQFLSGTGKFVYEDLMNGDSYNHSMALDGDTNLEMMVYYLDYLIDKNNGNLYASLKNYRGKGGNVLTNYIKRIDSYLSSTGKSVASIDDEY